MEKDISHPSVIDNVSAAKVDRTTRFIFDEFHSNGQLWFSLSVINNVFPYWLPPLRRLLKLASVYILILSEFILRLGNLMYEFLDLMCLRTLFNLVISGYGCRFHYCAGVAHFETEFWLGHISYPVQLSFELVILSSFFTC